MNTITKIGVVLLLALMGGQTCLFAQQKQEKDNPKPIYLDPYLIFKENQRLEKSKKSVIPATYKSESLLDLEEVKQKLKQNEAQLIDKSIPKVSATPKVEREVFKSTIVGSENFDYATYLSERKAEEDKFKKKTDSNVNLNTKEESEKFEKAHELALEKIRKEIPIIERADNFSGIMRVEPAYPNIDDEITIIYDASKGNAALRFASKVYFHSGLGLQENPATWNDYTIGNWGQDDGVGQMTRRVDLGNSIWSITLSPTARQYYGLPNNVTAYNLGMVFRNENSSLVGRGDNGENIYYPIYQSGISQTNSSDSLALVAFHKSTNGTNWTNQWDLTQPVNTWYGVSVNFDGRVTGLDLGRNNLTGTLTVQIGTLSELQNLNLQNNQISGSIPKSIGQLSNLFYLDLGVNQFSGEIPTTIGNLDNTNFLSFSSNRLTGEIPKEVGDMEKLYACFLTSNQLVGNLPIEFNQATQLQVLVVSFNQLSGDIPTALSSANWPSVREFEIDGNQFTSIPALTNFTRLYVNSNNLTFESIIPNL